MVRIVYASICSSLLLVLALLLPGCTVVPLKDPQLTSVNGNTIEFAQVTVQQPRVVFINGGGPGNMHAWRKVYTAVAERYSVFAYNRFGGGRSVQLPEPQTGERIVSTLRQLLAQQNLQPPYILVAHSLGGLYANLYARQYPQDVAGMVLLDPTHPQQFARLREQGVEPNVTIQKLLKLYKHINPTKYSEVATMEETGRQISQAGPFPNIPLIVISAPNRMGNPAENTILNQLMQELSQLSPQGIYRETPTSGHIIQVDQPQLVIQSIFEVIR